MNKKYITLMCLLLSLALVSGCGRGTIMPPEESQHTTTSGPAEEKSEFFATVLENHGASLLVEPEAGSWVRNSADKVSVSVANAELLNDSGTKINAGTLAAGAKVKISFTGGVAESYPAQIQGCYEIRLAGTNEPATDNTTITDNTTKSPGTQEVIPAKTQIFSTPAAGANDFAFRLSKELLKNSGKKNFVSSPYSVWLPLAALVNATEAAHKPALLAALSASGFSEKQLNAAAAEMLRNLTGEQMREYDKEYPNPLRIANAIFVDKKYTLNQNFKKTFADSYQGSFQTVDFLSPSAVKTVNDWASKNTDGLIKDIVSEFDPLTVAAIANAIYFSDRWSWEFDPGQTKKDTFHGTDGDTDAWFMLREGDKQTYYEDDKLQAMPLHFKTGGGLYILLPKNGDANALLSSMTPARFEEIQNGSSYKTGKLLLPRFSIDSGIMNLVNTLKALGVPLFDKDAAPLTGGLVQEDIDVFLATAVQKAVIKVDEKGTTAAAVTVMTMETTSMPLPTDPFSMICDKPFAFVLYGSTGQVLFTGVVNQI